MLFAPGRADFYVNIIDPEYSGTIDSPYKEGFNNFDLETGLPVFKGEIIFITGNTVSRQGGNITIPSTITRDKTFIVEVNSIASHCLTASGSEFVGRNSWYNTNDNSLKFKKVYIPSSIESVAHNAFVDVPEEVEICYEGNAIPEDFADGWMDRPSNIVLNKYGDEENRKRSVGDEYKDYVDERGRPINFCLGCKPDGVKYIGNEYDRPLVLEFDVVKRSDHSQVVRKVFDALPLTNTNKSSYDSVGRISDYSYSRLYGYKLSSDEIIDEKSIVFHNIMKFGKGTEINTSQRYFAKPTKHPKTIDLSSLVSFKAANSSTFAGYSMFSLTMDKNLSITSEKYPEPHSLYLDIKSDFYEQNKSKILAGLTEIRYSLYNLYLTSYHFVYEGSGGELKDIVVPVSTAITYQTLDKDQNNKISIILKNKDIASDFSAEKVRTFELVNLTIQMDLLTTSDSGSKAKLAKSEASYQFAYVTVRDNEKAKVFNWNVFLFAFLASYVVVFTGASFATYKIKKEKYKNDEFRRVNDKKFLKSSILYGLGFLVIAYAIIFIFMRAVGFANTIVAFNPTDPLLIGFAIAGMIIGGYFIVLGVKAVKAEKERRKAIRLRLNEDVEDDGTN